uniref:Ig-like domain-containing protein n=1 Tax=Pyxicephalus adspersus TaxID=30357 RepID=A0AAV3A7G9_PYXAD|nr:TPA: hypothetical protein GDO54_014015 [Pyxicephalus adspersus]
MSWAALFITSVLFCTYCAAQVSVTQPTSESISLGDTVSLSCTVSGFSIGDRWVHWFQQKTGEKPQYLLQYKSDSEKHHGTGIPDRFFGSKDTSKNTGYLFINSATAEDEADYYCFMWHESGSISQTLWWIFGGGTGLTVLNGEVKAPSVLLYPPSQEEMKTGMATVVCFMNDFYPRVLSMEFQVNGQKRTDGVSTSQVIKQSNNLYTASSFLSLNSTEYDKCESISCKVTHEGKDVIQTLNRSECM